MKMAFLSPKVRFFLEKSFYISPWIKVSQNKLEISVYIAYYFKSASKNYENDTTNAPALQWDFSFLIFVVFYIFYWENPPIMEKVMLSFFVVYAKVHKCDLQWSRWPCLLCCQQFCKSLSLSHSFSLLFFFQ